MRLETLRSWAPPAEKSVDLIAGLTLLLVLMYSGVYWFTKIPLSVLFIAGFIWRGLLSKPQFWFAACCFVGAEVFIFWYESDNHKFLTTYWLLSLALIAARPTEERGNLLRLHGRIYLIAVMSFAVLWKAMSSDFLDGSFFHFTLLTDERFAYFTHYLTGLPLSSLAENRAIWDGIFLPESTTRELVGNAWVEFLAKFMAIFTIVIEAAIPLAFLFLERTRALAHLLLIGFILVTYPVASVIGFAWLLILFALTQVQGERDGAWRFAYCVTFILTQSFRMDFGNVAKYLAD